MLHCGLRQKEASQLLISDIHTRNGLSYISVQADNSDIKSVKNEHSRRSIPIHQQLIDWGFLEYVEEQQKKTTSDNNRLNEIVEEIKINLEPIYKDQHFKWKKL